MSRGSAHYHLPPLTLPTNDFLKSVSGSFVFLSLRIRLQRGAACHFVLHVIALSGIGPNIMENDVVVVGFNSSGFSSSPSFTLYRQSGCWVPVASQGSKTRDIKPHLVQIVYFPGIRGPVASRSME